MTKLRRTVAGQLHPRAARRRRRLRSWTFRHRLLAVWLCGTDYTPSRPLRRTAGIVIQRTAGTRWWRRLLDGQRAVCAERHPDMDGEPEPLLSIITGPNMAGKSTYMRQVAVIVIMAQIGCFVPASAAEIGIVDGIYTRVGASDDLAAGQSTFMVEMSRGGGNFEERHEATALLILDEIGRGTSTFDGMSIARAVIEYVHDKKLCGAKTLFATHYHELTELEDLLPGVQNFSIAVKKRGDDITFLRRIVRGGADDSFGIEVAKLAGVPDKVVRRAKEVLKSLESGEMVKKPKNAVKVQQEEPIQLTMLTKDTEVLNRLKSLDVNTLTPIESMNILFELANMLK